MQQTRPFPLLPPASPVPSPRWFSRQRLSGFAAAVALVLTGAATALGANCEPGDDVFLVDTKVFPATFCQQLGTTSTLRYDSSGRVLNPSTTAAVTVLCPLVRDNAVGRWASIQVVVADRNPNANVTCTARSNQTDGLGWSTAPRNPLATGFFNLNWWASQTLEFGRPNDERDYGTFFVSCTIPPRYNAGSGNYESGIYSYRIHEFSGCTDPN